MPSIFGGNLNRCFSKIRRQSERRSLQANSLRPQTQDQDQDQDHSWPCSKPTISPSSILIKNYNSLYDHTLDHYSTSSLSATSSSSVPPDSFLFASAFASDRFFFSSPGHSNSIIEPTAIDSTSALSSSAITATTTWELNDDVLFTKGVAVPTYSPDPYKDFRQSMQEMVEAREQMDVKKSSWEFLHELLLCYLAINSKSTHKFIFRAFADLLVSIMPSPEDASRKGRD